MQNINIDEEKTKLFINKRAESSRKYYYENKEKVNLQQKAYREKNAIQEKQGKQSGIEKIKNVSKLINNNIWKTGATLCEEKDIETIQKVEKSILKTGKKICLKKKKNSTQKL